MSEGNRIHVDQAIKGQRMKRAMYSMMVLIRPITRLATARAVAMRTSYQTSSVVLFIDFNGQGGIRTHVTITRKQHFQCCSFNRSDTCPGSYARRLALASCFASMRSMRWLRSVLIFAIRSSRLSMER